LDKNSFFDPKHRIVPLYDENLTPTWLLLGEIIPFAIRGLMHDSIPCSAIWAVSCIPHAVVRPAISSIMQSHLIDEASEIIEDPKTLINVISRRVCQLTNGHRPLVEASPGTGHSDIALMEVIQKKISYEPTLEFNAEMRPPRNSDFNRVTSNYRAA
jgi:DNA-directed RNA polymerase subunit omega